ncbi:MAG: hypothetical protein LAO20_10340 [Acidobacteriia bacterium]|nr:hypothetical protein [Terriglobia bacterium]
MKPKTEYPEKIRALQEFTGMNQGQFADALGVPQSLVSACQSGAKPPSTDLLVRLGKVAAEQKRYDDAIWFLGEAGVELGVLESIGDKLRADRTSSAADDDIHIRSLEGPEDKQFKDWMIVNKFSTRFLRVRSEGKPFTIRWQSFEAADLPTVGKPFAEGDILLVDPSGTDLNALEAGAFIAISAKGNYLAGFLKKRPAGIKGGDCLLARPGLKDIFLARLDSGTVEMFPDLTVFGRVVGWLCPAKEKH